MRWGADEDKARKGKEPRTMGSRLDAARPSLYHRAV
jgi:hypothetical protein